MRHYGHLNEHLRIEVYKKLIKPVLLYNNSTQVLTANDEFKLDTFHRKQLRRVIDKRYPDEISSAKVYEKCKTYLISLQITVWTYMKIGSKYTSLHLYVILLFNFISRSL